MTTEDKDVQETNEVAIDGPGHVKVVDEEDRGTVSPRCLNGNGRASARTGSNSKTNGEAGSDTDMKDAGDAEEVER